MSPVHTSCVLLLILSVCTSTCTCSQLLHEICVSASNCLLRCSTENNSSDVQIKEVTWYKIRDFESSGVSGLASPILLNRTNSFDGDLDQEGMLQESHHLLLPDVTCMDAGMYTCQVTTAGGGESWKGRVLLTVTDCSDEQKMTDFYWLILSSAVLMLALLTFLISYLILRNASKDRKTSPVKDIVSNSPFKPLGQQELESVHTLGSKTCTMTHVWV